MKAELKQHRGHLDWNATNRQVRRLYAEMLTNRMNRNSL